MEGPRPSPPTVAPGECWVEPESPPIRSGRCALSSLADGIGLGVFLLNANLL